MARRFAGFDAAALALLLIAFSPMLFFFDRLALGDTILQTATTVWIWSLTHALGPSDAKFSLAVAWRVLCTSAPFLSKAPAIVLLPLPAVLCLVLPRWRAKDRLKWLAVYYALVAFAMLSLLLALASMRLDYFDVYAVRGAQSPRRDV